MKKTEINEKCPLRKMKYCDRQCAWRLDAGCSIRVLAVVALNNDQAGAKQQVPTGKAENI